MKAKDVMTKNVITINPQTVIGEAIKILVDNAISGVPVIDENSEIIGLITEKDLMVAFDFSQEIDVPVENFMSKEIVGVDEDTPVKEISQILVRKNIKRVPVLNGLKILGIISRRDILKYILTSNGK